MMINVKLLGSIEVDKTKCKVPDSDTPECMTSEQYQAAFGIGSSTLAIVLLACSLCFCLGLGTIIPQAYGSGNYKLCSVYRNRMIILATCIFTPFLIPIQFVEYLFLAMNQSKNIAREAALYIRVISPSVIVYDWSMCYGAYASLQGRPHFGLYSTIGASIIHMGIAYYFTKVLEWKMFGIALSSGIHFVLRFLI